MKVFLKTVLGAITLGILALFFAFTTIQNTKQKPPQKKKEAFDTCYYFLSGYGLAPIGATILNIKAIDCKCIADSVDNVLNAELREKYPDDYFMMENRKVNGPFKSLDDAENAILKMRNISR